jgi:hypothetical protein
LRAEEKLQEYQAARDDGRVEESLRLWAEFLRLVEDEMKEKEETVH